MSKIKVESNLIKPRFSDKKLLILMSVVVITLLVDSQIGYIADFISERLATNEGIALFIGIAVVFAAGGILILQYVKTKTKESHARALHLRAIHIGVTIAQYVLIAIIDRASINTITFLLDTITFLLDVLNQENNARDNRANIMIQSP